jgi:hypothetical protein|tara:strand:+ start:3659 stop:4027 length:369 start_codon:yes stop_codon:yes gene_type:complete
MTIRKIHTKGKSNFTDRIENWCADKGFEFAPMDKEDKAFEEIDSLVIFHEDHNLDDANIEIRDIFERKLKPIHKIDINGTKQVITSHYLLWVERNSCKNLLFIGNDLLTENPNTDLLLDKMA